MGPPCWGPWSLSGPKLILTLPCVLGRGVAAEARALGTSLCMIIAMPPAVPFLAKNLLSHCDRVSSSPVRPLIRYFPFRLGSRETGIFHAHSTAPYSFSSGYHSHIVYSCGRPNAHCIPGNSRRILSTAIKSLSQAMRPFSACRRQWRGKTS